MTKYKDLPEKRIVGRFAKEGDAYKKYGQEEIKIEGDMLKNNIPLADLIAKLYRFGDNITKEEYLSK